MNIFTGMTRGGFPSNYTNDFEAVGERRHEKYLIPLFRCKNLMGDQIITGFENDNRIPGVRASFYPFHISLTQRAFQS